MELALVALALFVLLIALGVPIAFVLLALSLLFVLHDPAIIDLAFAQRVLTGTQSFPLLAVPLFILTGELMNISGISRRVMQFAALLTHRLQGGMAQANIVLSTLLAGMSGSANGDAAMQAKVMVPEMARRGYPVPFATVLTASSALIAPMIPPGIGLILFGFVTDVSIGRMFLGGVVPGLMLALGLMITTWLVVRRRGWEPARERPADAPSLLASGLNALPAIMLPVIVIVGIRAGVFTPTEAAGVAVCYALLFCAVYRETSWRQLFGALRATVIATSAILLVLAASAAFSWVLTFERVPHAIGEVMLSLTSSPSLMLLIIAGALLICGMFIEGTALILILGPMFLPLVEGLGIDPVHYGIVFVFTVHLGGITPPVGTIMFTSCAITRTPIGAFARNAVPYIGTVILLGLILILVPGFSTWLPSL